jgi:hypothetical protein
VDDEGCRSVCGWNLYDYAGADPLNWIDPRGNTPILIVVGTVVAVATAVYAIYKFINASIEAGDAVQKS